MRNSRFLCIITLTVNKMAVSDFVIPSMDLLPFSSYMPRSSMKCKVMAESASVIAAAISAEALLLDINRRRIGQKVGRIDPLSSKTTKRKVIKMLLLLAFKHLRNYLIRQNNTRKKHFKTSPSPRITK